jgi:hypothetical protein
LVLERWWFVYVAAQRSRVKPSPISSILLFVGAALLLYAAVSVSWFTASFEESSFSMGLIRGESCNDGTCRTATIFSGGRLGASGLLAILMFILTISSAGLAVPTGILLFKPGRRVLSLITVIIVGCAGLLSLVLLLKYGKGEAKFGLAFYAFWLAVMATVAACIIAMLRPRAAGGQPMRPMGMPGMQPQMYPGQQPMQQQPQMYPGQQPMQQQPQMYPGQQPMQPQQAPQGAPCPTCATPTTWVAQYTRWFCQRCNKYV